MSFKLPNLTQMHTDIKPVLRKPAPSSSNISAQMPLEM